MVAEIEELEKMDVSEIHARRLNSNEVLTPENGENFIFPVAGNSQSLWERAGSENIHLNPGPPRQGNHPGESDGSSPTLRDSSPFAGEARNVFWSIAGHFNYRHHVEPRVKLHVPREVSFPIPLK